MRLAASILFALLTGPALAGTCRNQSVNGESVTVCDNGYAEVRGSRRARSFGVRNGGFERYPGQPVPPYAIERGERP